MARQGGGLKVAHLAGPGFQNKFLMGSTYQKIFLEDENELFCKLYGGHTLHG